MSDKAPKVFADPLDFDELFPGRFLKAGEFKDKKVTLTMTRVKIEELVGDKGAVVKGVISFKETDKQLALNKTNGICLRGMFGRLVQGWVGKRVTLFPGMWDGDQAIRVWGSPDIEADMEVTVALPRKRPFTMPMHAMRKAGGNPAVPAADHPSSPESGATTGARAADGENSIPDKDRAKDLIRNAKTLDALEEARRTVWGLYAAAKVDVPLDVEFAATIQREALEAPE